MKITKQTSNELVVKANSKFIWFFLGLILLAGGIAIVTLVRTQPVTFLDLQTAELFIQQQKNNPAIDGEVEAISINEAGYRIANYVGNSLFVRERPIIAIAVISIIVGAFIVLGPYRGRSITFDKSKKLVRFKQARWFFRSLVEQYPFHEIYDVRVERDRSRRKADDSFGVNVVVTHSEGLPLTRNYVSYKTVFPVSESFRYQYEPAKKIVSSIKTFMADVRNA